ncbi:NAD(P)/FAD-dependent oxidoreductase [Poseidonibacter ostreae]|jgi:predicted Rossmann fold flavoprotein|uniref:Aminoacetone oxidase family FAD-binding enzyme n=1 Tax=Poseidonibacter ostreae TaxID=2654171 RepID=A0A6L4WW79_9BACT|nr:NAD(P)/FAD-dependent oxidoreductase [Poseidonibacter ostreae]KAB7885613.1 aminoacetone oxidase family FAD-binding enzyme [Poseidonibacter ostreae]KAB7890988.1 aminoacetone oxidase family FAD-binding enzyme [Poseidonibacter ostreae]KAB7892712.1 aminoacetone oxidase family FAD-binding enzyme [Poseidonibacter ostreae]MAC83663.1 aminoacetone oxidase family FAD-binding enzyme [Arcobacter sp.]
MKTNNYDVIVIGSGGAGMIASITARKQGKNVLLLEKLPALGAKLKATGGGKCNLTNTLSSEEFMNSFGKNGRFMTTAINMLNRDSLREFFLNIGVQTDTKDGFRIFPVTHNSSTIIKALEKELNSLGVDIECNQSVQKLLITKDRISGVQTQDKVFNSPNVIVATGGLGFPVLGAHGDGYEFAKELGHKITDLYPAMLPVYTKETWVANCTADTIAKAIVKIDLKKAKKLKAVGDLIFTSKGLRGPVILDFSREITPLLEKYDEVPLLINMVKGKNEDEVLQIIKKHASSNPDSNVLDNASILVPKSVAKELCQIVNADINKKFKEQNGEVRNNLIKILTNTPLTVIDSVGFKKAMITRGGVTLKEIDPTTMKSKIVDGLYFCGEVMDLDGPCGGFNLQWSFSSGNLAGHLL